MPRYLFFYHKISFYQIYYRYKLQIHFKSYKFKFRKEDKNDGKEVNQLKKENVELKTKLSKLKKLNIYKVSIITKKLRFTIKTALANYYILPSG